MAESVAIDSHDSEAKIRHPVAVAALTLVTLGIYAIYWWYQVNREMADFGRERDAEGLGDSPGKSLMAMFPGALVIVPPIISLYNGVQRMQRTQEVRLGHRTLSGWVVLGCYVGGFIIPFLGVVAHGYMQAELNKVWEALRRGDVGGGTLGPGMQELSGAAGQRASAPPSPPPPPPAPETAG